MFRQFFLALAVFCYSGISIEARQSMCRAFVESGSLLKLKRAAFEELSEAGHHAEALERAIWLMQHGPKNKSAEHLRLTAKSLVNLNRIEDAFTLLEAKREEARSEKEQKKIAHAIRSTVGIVARVHGAEEAIYRLSTELGAIASSFLKPDLMYNMGLGLLSELNYMNPSKSNLRDIYPEIELWLGKFEGRLKDIAQSQYVEIMLRAEGLNGTLDLLPQKFSNTEAVRWKIRLLIAGSRSTDAKTILREQARNGVEQALGFKLNSIIMSAVSGDTQFALDSIDALSQTRGENPQVARAKAIVYGLAGLEVKALEIARTEAGSLSKLTEIEVKLALRTRDGLVTQADQVISNPSNLFDKTWARFLKVRAQFELNDFLAARATLQKLSNESGVMSTAAIALFLTAEAKVSNISPSNGSRSMEILNSIPSENRNTVLALVAQWQKTGIPWVEISLSSPQFGY